MKNITLTLVSSLVATLGYSDEVVQLIDGTKMVGTLQHYYEGTISLKVGGEELKIPREKIRSITFELPKARPELSSPEKTFERWRQALTRGDMPTVVDCYALMYQGMLAQQLEGNGNEDFRKMQDEVKQTKFQVKNSQQKGDTATLKVVRQQGDDVETAELRFVREAGEWKMTP